MSSFNTYYREEDAAFVKDCKNLLDISSNRELIRRTDFLEPNKQKILQDLCKKYSDLNCELYGVTCQAERKRAIIYPRFYDSDSLDYMTAVIQANFAPDAKITHRDFLGALIACGLKRDKIGDIIITGNKAYIIVDSIISNFILDNLLTVGSYNVKLKLEDDFDKIKDLENSYEEISGTSASLRLDAIIKMALNLSRSQASEYINKKLVKYNWNSNIKASQLVHINDIISVRGKGKFKISEIQLNEKNKRYRINIKKYI